MAARSASQARLFDTALSNTPDFVYTFDLAGRITYVNQALLALWQAFQRQKLADITNRINTAHDVNSVLGVVTQEARTLFNSHQATTSMVLDPHHPEPINVVSNSEKYPRRGFAQHRRCRLL